MWHAPFSNNLTWEIVAVEWWPYFFKSPILVGDQNKQKVVCHIPPFLVSIRWWQSNFMAVTKSNGDNWTYFVHHPIVAVESIGDRIHFSHHLMRPTEFNRG
jgi:hypothetical protein